MINTLLYSNNGLVKISYNQTPHFLYQIAITCNKKKKKIPLLLDISEIPHFLKNIHNLKKRKPYYHFNYKLLTQIVAGAARISKRGGQK